MLRVVVNGGGVTTRTQQLDAENQLTQVKRGSSVVATFVYDGDGQRVKATLNGNMTLRVEISGTQIITCVQEFDAENRLTQVTNLPVYQVTSYGYDGDGNLAWRESGGIAHDLPAASGAQRERVAAACAIRGGAVLPAGRGRCGLVSW